MEKETICVENFIGGTFVTRKPEHPFIPSYNPATGNVWATLPDSTTQDVETAVNAASRAFPAWSALTPEARAGFLLKIADRIDARLDQLALAESRDQGKPVNLAKKMDIPRASINFRVFAQAWQHHLETSNAMPGAGVINYSSRHPVGVAGLISPWNLPLYLLTFKMAPALMAGNTVVCKPSEMTSVTAWMLCSIMLEVGLPSGVVNMVFGYGNTVGEAIVTHPQVRIISFTGSTVVGQKIAALTAPAMKKVSLELGGKNAAVVFDDADIDAAVAGVTRSAFLNQGEICLCTSRIFVQRAIYQTFLEKLVASVEALVTGDPEEDETFCGAVNSKQHYQKVTGYLQIAKDEGGLLHTGTKPLELSERCKGGFFIRPTLISGLPDSSRCMQEEIFGPVACITQFDSEKEVVARVNNTRYGLCASVWSQNVGRVHRVSQQLEVGTVWSNCWLVRSLGMPFGGCKESGTGMEGTRHSLEAFTREKTNCIKIS